MMYYDKTNHNDAAHYARLLQILGAADFPETIESSFDFIRLASLGIDARAIVNFQDYFGFTRDRTASLMQVSEPTIYRWVRDEKKLDQRHSMQVLELVNLLLYGIEVIGSKEHFTKWLGLPNMALGGMEPVQLLELPGGIEKVRQLLGRIEYGIFS
jgi:putative toxin-antitoxin system antitoxin component (TIGR02293 family)